MQISSEGEEHNRKKKKKGKKEKKKKKERERKERKREGMRRKGKRKKEKRKSVFRRLELVGPRSKVQRFNEGYASRGRDSFYFGLLLAFGLLFWANF